MSFEPGTYKIEGDNLFVDVASYEIQKAEERFGETHKQYLDVHLMLEGLEQGDFLPMDWERRARLAMNPDDFLICYPEDGHRIAVAVREPEQIKSAIFKVRIWVSREENDDMVYRY